jgi:hypothetical protein
VRSGLRDRRVLDALTVRTKKRHPNLTTSGFELPQKEQVIDQSDLWTIGQLIETSIEWVEALAGGNPESALFVFATRLNVIALETRRIALIVEIPSDMSIRRIQSIQAGWSG